CREDVDDLLAVEVRRPARARWIAAAAAVAAAIALVVVATRWWTPEAAVAPRAIRVKTATAPPAPSDPWHDMLRSAIASGRLEEPAVLATLRPRKETLRGPHAHEAVMRAPVAVV